MMVYIHNKVHNIPHISYVVCLIGQLYTAPKQYHNTIIISYFIKSCIFYYNCKAGNIDGHILSNFLPFGGNGYNLITCSKTLINQVSLTLIFLALQYPRAMPYVHVEYHWNETVPGNHIDISCTTNQVIGSLKSSIGWRRTT